VSYYRRPPTYFRGWRAMPHHAGVTTMAANGRSVATAGIVDRNRVPAVRPCRLSAAIFSDRYPHEQQAKHELH